MHACGSAGEADEVGEEAERSWDAPSGRSESRTAMRSTSPEERSRKSVIEARERG